MASTNDDANGHRDTVLHEIEQMEQVVGKRMYRGSRVAS